MSTVDNDRPPFVQFEIRPVEDRKKSQETGHYVGMDVPFIIVTRPGSRDTYEQEASAYLSALREKVRQGQVPQLWYDSISAQFKAFQEGEELPETGTPVKTWPPLSPAMRKELLHIGVRTVEDLAAMPDSEVATIGTGGIALKQKAIAWLAASKDQGKVAEQVSALQVQIAELVNLTRQQAEEIQNLRKQVPKAA